MRLHYSVAPRRDNWINRVAAAAPFLLRRLKDRLAHVAHVMGSDSLPRVAASPAGSPLRASAQVDSLAGALASTPA